MQGFAVDEVVRSYRVRNVVAASEVVAVRLCDPDDALLIAPGIAGTSDTPEAAAEELRALFASSTLRSRKAPGLAVVGILVAIVTFAGACWPRRRLGRRCAARRPR